MNEQVVVIKLDQQRRETWRYSGTVLRRWPDAVLLQARFNRDDMDFHGMPFGRGDRFIEIYYSDRWYNLYELHDQEDDHLKGWYCNVGMPAEISAVQAGLQISYVDLALDLLVFPDGRQLVLDEDEFAALDLNTSTAASAGAALDELKIIFKAPVRLRLAEAYS